MRRLYKAKGKRQPSSPRPGGRGLKVGMEAIPTAREKMVAGWRWILAKYRVEMDTLSPWDTVSIYSTQRLSLLVRLTPFFLFWRGLMESRFNYNIFLAR